MGSACGQWQIPGFALHRGGGTILLRDVVWHGNSRGGTADAAVLHLVAQEVVEAGALKHAFECLLVEDEFPDVGLTQGTDGRRLQIVDVGVGDGSGVGLILQAQVCVAGDCFVVGHRVLMGGVAVETRQGLVGRHYRHFLYAGADGLGVELVVLVILAVARADGVDADLVLGADGVAVDDGDLRAVLA